MRETGDREMAKWCSAERRGVVCLVPGTPTAKRPCSQHEKVSRRESRRQRFSASLSGRAIALQQSTKRQQAVFVASCDSCCTPSSWLFAPWSEARPSSRPRHHEVAYLQCHPFARVHLCQVFRRLCRCRSHRNKDLLLRPG